MTQMAFGEQCNYEHLYTARLELEQAVERGALAECPCCGQGVKRYYRRLNSGLAYQLITAYRMVPDGYFHARDVLLAARAHPGGDFTKARYWGLIYGNDAERDDGSRRNGDWCFTNVGRAFIEGRITVPARIILDRGQFLGFDGPAIGIRDALGSAFDYEELMSR